VPHYADLEGEVYFLRAHGFTPAWRLCCVCGWRSAWRPSPHDAGFAAAWQTHAGRPLLPSDARHPM
jgi:hypothetical protein